MLIYDKVYSQHYFNINHFEAAGTDIELRGKAMTASSGLILTPYEYSVNGACWYRRDKIDVVNGFQTEFTFIIEGEKSNHGDGFAFVIQNNSIEAFGKPGSSLGYRDIPFGVALEFDTKDDDEGSSNHIAVATWNQVLGKYVDLATVHEIPEITDGKEHFTRIEYKDGRMTVFLDSYLFPVISLKLDLRESMGLEKGYAWIGFTAATSEKASVHKLLEWKANELAQAPEKLNVEKVQIQYSDTLYLSSRKIKMRVWDNNKVDGDMVSVRLNDEWILSNYVITKKDKIMELSLTGFENTLILYAQNLGDNPPNTATFLIEDGVERHVVELNADFEKSEAILIRFRPN